MENIIILKIKKTHNNCFLSINNIKGLLLSYKTFKQKKSSDNKIKITWALVLLLKKLKIKNKKIKYIHLYIQNLDLTLIQHIFTFFKTWDINISFLKYQIPIPHNGCRKNHKARIRQKKLININIV